MYDYSTPGCHSWPIIMSELDEKRETLTWNYPKLHASVVDFLILDIWQAGRCAMCARGRTPSIQAPRPETASLLRDHDHSTGLIRGLLCAGCNSSEWLPLWDLSRINPNMPDTLEIYDTLIGVVERAERYRRQSPTYLLELSIPHGLPPNFVIGRWFAVNIFMNKSGKNERNVGAIPPMDLLLLCLIQSDSWITYSSGRHASNEA